MRLLLAVLLLVVLGAVPVAAQRGTIRPSNEPVLIKADQLTHHQDLGTIVATGNVEIVQGDKILLADTVTYSEREDKVTASGNVSLTQATGTSRTCGRCSPTTAGSPPMPRAASTATARR